MVFNFIGRLIFERISILFFYSVRKFLFSFFPIILVVVLKFIIVGIFVMGWSRGSIIVLSSYILINIRIKTFLRIKIKILIFLIRIFLLRWRYKSLILLFSYTFLKIKFLRTIFLLNSLDGFWRKQRLIFQIVYFLVNFLNFLKLYSRLFFFAIN